MRENIYIFSLERISFDNVLSVYIYIYYLAYEQRNTHMALS